MSANKSRDANICVLTFNCQRDICRADTKYRANIVTVISSSNDGPSFAQRIPSRILAIV